MRLLEYNTGEMLLDIGVGSDFLEIKLKTQTTKPRHINGSPSNKRDRTAAETIHSEKQPMEWEKICDSHISDRG